MADIDWWSVTPGQTPDEETEDVNLADQNPDSPGLVLEGLLEIAGLFSDALAAEHIPLAVGAPETSQELPTSAFSALSISPNIPRRPFTRQSSVSSLDSIHEAGVPDSFDGLRLSLPDIENDFPEPVFPVLGRVSGPTLSSLRGHSFSDFGSYKTDPASHYADFTVSPLSAAFPYICN